MATATTSMNVTTYMSGGRYDYDIKMVSGGSQVTIFKGKTYTQQGALSVVDVGAIAKDYLEVSVPTLSATSVTQHTKATGIFKHYFGGTPTDTWFLRDDYSGESWTGADKELSDPINGHVDPRQMILYSAFNNSTAYKNIIPQ